MPDSLEERYIRLKVISGMNLKISSWRILAGIYVSINVNSRSWNSAISVLPSDESVAWGDTATLLRSSHASPALSVETRASYELGQMLGSGEVGGKLRTPWDRLLDHGDELFDLFFPSMCGVPTSLTLKATVVRACDDQDGVFFDSLVDCEITRDTDTGYALFTEYMTSKTVSHLHDAVQHFQFVLDRYSVDHPDHAEAFTNFAFTCLEGYMRDHLQDIDTTTSLFHQALALRSQGHSDHTLYPCDLIRGFIWPYGKESAAVYIHESTQLWCKLLPPCPGGSCLRSMHVDSAIGYVIGNLPIDTSDEGIHLRWNVHQLCLLEYQLHPRALRLLPLALETRFQQCGSIHDIDEIIQLRRETAFLFPEGHSDHDDYLHNATCSPESRFDHRGNPNDLDEAISLYEEALRLGGSLIGQPRMCPPSFARDWHCTHLGDTTLNNLALALNEDLNEAIDRYRESLRLKWLDDPERHRTLYNLSSALCSRFTHTRMDGDVEEAIILCQESLEALPLPWTALYFVTRCRKLQTGIRTPYSRFSECIQTALKWVAEAEDHQHDSAPAVVHRLASGSTSRHGRHPRYQSIVLQRHYYPNVRRVFHRVLLSSIALADLRILKDRFTRSIRHASRTNPAESSTDLIVLLRSLWDEIMLLIVNVFEHILKLKHRSRIWPCLTAAFTSIPLHAANPFQTKADCSGKESCVEDLYIYSYTPTLPPLVDK
ncbi:uncharacterized protein HD556DRAFT_1457785 [Suillus plorans]|uniref:Uncharacterized protein n=1 Tax=Suillus plorans TaxID=116603 RepID=A0A9P7J271_9AGAM|nr:uncharacterized protein HD556DRAFT_1457785 [Suillus plorans]KAG1799308.1 hypothetical protein HD556DRAFT_1457785 [Suillus plorans]